MTISSTKKNIDELLIRVSGRFPIQKKLELGKDYRLEMIVCPCKKEIYDNQDGSVSICWAVKPLESEINKNI